MRGTLFQLAMISAVAVLLAQPHLAYGADVSTNKSNGSTVFQANCQVCHGEDGSGSEVGKSLHAPDLRSAKIQTKSTAELARFISEGNGAMPSFKDRLSHQEILDEIRYIRVLGKHK